MIYEGSPGGIRSLLRWEGFVEFMPGFQVTSKYSKYKLSLSTIFGYRFTGSRPDITSMIE